MYRQRLGDAVREARMNLELSQNTLAERSHVSLRTISDIETYKANPRFDSLCSLASYLNISIDAVIKDRKNNRVDKKPAEAVIEDLNEEGPPIDKRTMQDIADAMAAFRNM